MVGAFVPPMFAHICDIVVSCAPAKVFNRVIAGVTIKMSAFVPFWAGAYEGFKDKVVDISKIAAPQSDHLSAIFVVGDKSHLSPMIRHSPARS